jgi:Cu+-exporting ATPase
MAANSNMVLDPVCGMTIDPKKAAATRTFEGKTIYFCAQGCARQFDTDPARYAHEDAAGHGH